MLILAIETSCDETAAAVVEDGRRILSNVIVSQADLHQIFGGVVPEVASRKHMEAIVPVYRRALSEAGVTAAQIDAFAVTSGPGLVGALLVGVSFAKAAAYALHKPLVAVHHMKGHIAANYLETDIQPPFLCLVVSGGHSQIMRIDDYTSMTVLGKTRDDAAGEAFDKAARVLGLPYPGGPAVSKLAAKGDPSCIRFPQVHLDDNPYDFSFSGVKTSLIYFSQKLKQRGIDLAACRSEEILCEITPDGKAAPGQKQFCVSELSGGGVKVIPCQLTKADIAAAFEEAITGVLVQKTMLAVRKENLSLITTSGGVAANNRLRSKLEACAKEQGILFACPQSALCTDNAAMIASAACFEALEGRYAGLDLNAVAYDPL